MPAWAGRFQYGSGSATQNVKCANRRSQLLVPQEHQCESQHNIQQKFNNAGQN